MGRFLHSLRSVEMTVGHASGPHGRNYSRALGRNRRSRLSDSERNDSGAKECERYFASLNMTGLALQITCHPERQRRIFADQMLNNWDRLDEFRAIQAQAVLQTCIFSIISTPLGRVSGNSGTSGTANMHFQYNIHTAWPSLEHFTTKHSVPSLHEGRPNALRAGYTSKVS